MSATYTNSNSPRFNFLLATVATFMLLIAFGKCAAQIPVDKDVLNYLFSQSAKAYYLDKDIKLCDSINAYQKEILTSKDSIILGQSELINIRNSQNAICDMQLKSSQSENKKLSKKVSIFKFTTISVGIVSIVQYIKSLNFWQY